MSVRIRAIEGEDRVRRSPVACKTIRPLAKSRHQINFTVQRMAVESLL